MTFFCHIELSPKEVFKMSKHNDKNKEKYDIYFKWMDLVENSDNNGMDFPDNDSDDEYGDEYDDKLPADIAYTITERILKKETLLVVKGSIWRYEKSTGNFRELQNDDAEILIESYYKKKEQRLAKSSLASEIKTRICRHPELQAKYDDFNTKSDFINCKNGVIGIGLKECTLLPHSPEYRFTYCIDAKYLKTKAKAPTFDLFCDTSLSGDKKKRKLLLQIIGYSCSDMTGAKKAFFFKGEPDSGKSVMLNFLENLVGLDAVSNIPLHGLGERFNKACLFGKKINTNGEIKNIKFKDLSYLKSMTGGDRISAEFKHGQIFSYIPTAKLIFAGNALPLSEEEEATKAFINRICLLIFPHSIPKEKQDANLNEKLWHERHAIFSAAVDALVKLSKKNLKFAEPEDSKEHLCYFEGNSNSLDMFINDCCVFDQNAHTPVKEFTAAYQIYCDHNALEIIGKIKMCSRLMEKHKFARNRLHKKDSNIHHFMGISIKKTNAE